MAPFYTMLCVWSLVGFSTGWILYKRATAFAANSNALALILALIPWFSMGPEELHYASTCLLVTWVNYIIKDGIKMLLFFTVIKLLPVLIIVIMGLQYIPIEFFTKASLPQMNGIGPTVLIIIYAFVGFEGATFISANLKTPIFYA